MKPLLFAWRRWGLAFASVLLVCPVLVFFRSSEASKMKSHLRFLRCGFVFGRSWGAFWRVCSFWAPSLRGAGLVVGWRGVASSNQRLSYYFSGTPARRGCSRTYSLSMSCFFSLHGSCQASLLVPPAQKRATAVLINSKARVVGDQQWTLSLFSNAVSSSSTK